MASRSAPRGAPPEPVPLALPFTGRWRAQNSPARRVPSHGSDLFGETYAIDLIGVDERGRTARRVDWRTALATEPPERFWSYGRPVLAPAAGVVVAAHGGEPDHAARRTPVTLVPYAVGQAARARRGVSGVAGNHLVIRLAEDTYLALVHLQRGSLRVARGDPVITGELLAACGNSGNSTQPHLHLQVMDSADLAVARGLPIAFADFVEHPRSGTPLTHRLGLPQEHSILEPLEPVDEQETER
ncbi:M23 family metallopeptidase [Nocardioides insulae]|uniref:M23 family metallopeptidase n=1 Tax=Nocardioides insulae TaxID=394734 RepID=UPI00048C150F|nr:M23 family metallopeptidase [Nocardioides insulae]